MRLFPLCVTYIYLQLSHIFLMDQMHSRHYTAHSKTTHLFVFHWAKKRCLNVQTEKEQFYYSGKIKCAIFGVHSQTTKFSELHIEQLTDSK